MVNTVRCSSSDCIVENMANSSPVQANDPPAPTGFKKVTVELWGKNAAKAMVADWLRPWSLARRCQC